MNQGCSLKPIKKRSSLDKSERLVKLQLKELFTRPKSTRTFEKMNIVIQDEKLECSSKSLLKNSAFFSAFKSVQEGIFA